MLDIARFGGNGVDAGITRAHSMVLRIEGYFGKSTEFFGPGVSKWRALQGIFPEAAATPKTVIAIGDEANDVEMIREAGMGVAMGNAIDPLKAVAVRITATASPPTTTMTASLKSWKNCWAEGHPLPQ